MSAKPQSTTLVAPARKAASSLTSRVKARYSITVHRERGSLPFYRLLRDRVGVWTSYSRIEVVERRGEIIAQELARIRAAVKVARSAGYVVTWPRWGICLVTGVPHTKDPSKVVQYVVRPSKCRLARIESPYIR